jgi:hypothetical protein
MALINERGDVLAGDAGLMTYEADWYSGAQIQVMIGDIHIDNAVAISWQVSGDRVPVYGFGSEYFAFAAKTPVFVRGALTIAYKESFYLLKPAARAHNRAVRGLITSPRISEGRARGFSSLAQASQAGRQGYVRHQNVEQLYQNVKNARNTGQPLSSGLIKQLAALEDSAFEDAAEKFEDAIWYGSDQTSPTTRSKLFSETMHDNFENIDLNTILSHRRLDQYPAVDIWITYGDMQAPNTVNHTVEKILDVYFTGESKEIMVGGEPVLSTHHFIARNRV